MRPETKPHDPVRARRAYARDLGLDMVGRAHRWLISGAVILAGGFSALTWHAFHAHAATAASRAAVSHPSSGSDDNTGASTTPLQAPSQAPAASTPAPAPTPAPVSGGS